MGGAFSDTNKSKYNMDDFNLIRVLGKGAFGKVSSTLTPTPTPTPTTTPTPTPSPSPNTNP